MKIAGIGSRETPRNILKEMVLIGEFCRKNKIYVRSGHAPGADQAFELGAQEFCIVYLPWPNFCKEFSSRGKVYIPADWHKLFEHAKRFHSGWHRLSQGVRKLMGRNSMQVLGSHLDTPVEYVIAWTKDGEATGGTGQAIRIARYYKIPVCNMFHEEWNTAEKCIREIKKHL